MDKQKHAIKPHTNSSNQFLAFLQQILNFLQEFWHFLKTTAIQISRALRELWHNFLRSFARWADPKLEPYREQKLATQKIAAERNEEPQATSQEDTQTEESAVIIKEETYTPAAPTSPEDLFALLRESPMSVLTAQERKIMTSLFELDDTPVSDIMTPAHKIVYVKQDETLGPLVLDKLYRSGFENFPVVDDRQHIIGTLQTSRLNQLDTKETSTAKSLMNPHVYYVRSDYTLAQALKAFLRTSEQLFIVTDRYEKTAGMLTFRQLLEFLFGGALQDDFSRDDDRIAVAKRKVVK